MRIPTLPRRGEAGAFWGLCWRMIVLAPVGILGVVLFTVVVGLWVLPAYAAVLIYNGDYFWAVGTLIGWGLWIRFGGPVRRLVNQGWEHGSL